MEKSTYVLLLNNSLKTHLLTLKSQEKKRLREKFEFLEHGIWDGGVRVKKLKGVSDKVIFEARISKAERVLFTLGTQGNSTAIYIWGIVKHNEISGKARNILPENAPFLSFEPETQEDYPDLSIDDLSHNYYSQERLEEKARDDYGPQKWLALSEKEWKRLLLKADPDNFEIFLLLTSEQRKILETDPPLLLSGTAGSGKTTISVYYLLHNKFINKKRIFLTYSPYLKRFSERIYTGLVKNTDYEQAEGPEFYVFHDLLKDMLSSYGQEYDWVNEVGLAEFEDIIRNHRLYKKYDTELVWEEIRSIIKGAKPPINVGRYKQLLIKYLARDITRKEFLELKDYLLGLKRFEIAGKIEKMIQKKTPYSDFDHFRQSLELQDNSSRDAVKFVLTETLKIIDKKSNSFSTPLLSFQEYMLLGKKRAPNFLYDRADIYSIAEYYQAKLEEQGLWDEIDLCKRVLELSGKKDQRWSEYDLVVCDEIQDFTDIQISLIFRLAKTYRSILFTGDPKQIINPSGFRWEEVKNKFYERGVQVPDVFNLNLNFRCVGNIVRLANILLDLKQQLIGVTSTELKEEWKFNGKPPLLLSGMEEGEVLEKIMITGASQIILTRSREEQEKLKKTLHTELVFTINQAKGLEFDTVFLWKFSDDKKSVDVWRRIRNEHYLEHSHFPHIKHEINLLYVAITRARNTLVIYEGKHCPDVWEIDLFQDHLYITAEKNALSQVWQRTSNPSEWEKQGDYFLEREYFPAALECYKNSGNLKKTEFCRAFVLEQKKDYLEAGKLFEKHQNYLRAAENYERSNNYEGALPLWEKLKNRKRMKICRIKLYEKKGEYLKAAEEWEKLKNHENAFKNWEKCGNQQKIAGYYFSRHQYKQAARSYELSGDLVSAAACYKKVQNYKKAAQLYFKAGDYKSAATLFKRLKDSQALLLCFGRLKDYYSEALLYEKQGETAGALDSFRKFMSLSRENRKLVLAEAKKFHTPRSSLKSAVRYAALDMHEQAASIFFKKKLYELAAGEYRQLQDHANLAECYAGQDRFHEAALEMESSNLDEKQELARQYLFSHLYSKSRLDKKRAHLLSQEAEGLYQSDFYDKALTRYKVLDNPERVYELCLKRGWDEDALGYFLDNEDYGYAKQYVSEKKDPDLSLEFLSYITEGTLELNYWYFKSGKDELELICGLLQAHYRKHRDEETLSVIDTFLSSLHFPFNFDGEAVDTLLDLLLEAKQYNAISDMIHFQMLNGELPPEISSFLDRLKQAADREGDNSLLACYYSVFDTGKYEEILKGLDPNRRNLELFRRSKESYQKAVDYYLSQDEIKRAIHICQIHEDFWLAGRISEDNGDLKAAGRYYRDAGDYEAALRCFQKIEDQAGIARVYERMEEFELAIDIWRKLGKTKQVARVKKKLWPEKIRMSQFELF
ncbi:hypothetical protein ES703_12394 [subsurface metagenome]